ncbi:hypothetical protein ISF26_23970 (plasmid) [Gloeobacter morelensis MG652769]|nr:hypothetical protein ISF26_23970 [Gloeobacter morelensis MG652769]
MSPDVVKLCIQAGTSEYGACPECGAPWKRKVVRRQPPRRPAGANPLDGGLTPEHGLDRTGMNHRQYTEWLHDHPPVALGWVPGCRCDAERTVPCVVLDPFAGSGTTLQVAQELGRRAVGIELNADYLPLIHERCCQCTIWGIVPQTSAMFDDGEKS